MLFSDIPILKHCDLYRIQYPKRPSANVKGRSFHSLSLRLAGATRIRGDRFELLSGPNTLTYVPANLPYQAEFTEEGEMIVMHFFTEDTGNSVPVTTPIPFPKSLQNLFEAATQRYTAKGCDLALMSMAYQLLAEAERIFYPKDPVPHRLGECKRFLDENITDPELRIRDLAKRCSMSEAWFRKEFEKYYGSPPLEYIKQKRLETAKLLLQTGIYSVTEIAFRSGFESSSYFSAEFRRTEGLSPREYKRRQK